MVRLHPRESRAIGAVLSGFRSEAKLTQEELADLAGVRRNLIGSIETGRARNPKYASIRRVVQACKRSMGEFEERVDKLLAAEVT
ncbi:MAG TPA: helix-turn-helix transcriptional regulator [Conexibacter sp.]